MAGDVFDSARGTEGSTPVEYSRSAATLKRVPKQEVEPAQTDPVHPLIATMVNMLPHPEMIWDKGGQDRWIEALRAVLRLVYHEKAS